MKKSDFTVHAKIDGDIFKHFALFDTFVRQRRWRSPAAFVGIMLLFSLIAFSQTGKVERAALLGGVLLGVGMLLPAVYIFSFDRSVRTQIKKLGLTKPRHVYTLQLNQNDGVMVLADKQQAAYRWEELFAAYRTNRCIYLYAAPVRAYLIPNEQIEGGADALWALLSAVMPLSQLHDHRRNR